MLPVRPILLHRFTLSGHCHRVQLLLSLLDVPFECVEVNLAAQEQKTARFLALNPFGQVPVIEDGDTVVTDSNAILIYLANKYGAERWLPDTPVGAAELQRWFSVAAGPLAFGPAAARAHMLFANPAALEPAQARARVLFQWLNAHLAKRDFLLGDRSSLADIANYAYTARAPEGGIPMDDYAHVRAWIERMENTPGFVAMPWAAAKAS